MIRTIILSTLIFAVAACNDSKDSAATFKPPQAKAGKARKASTAKAASAKASDTSSEEKALTESDNELIQRLIVLFSIQHEMKVKGAQLPASISEPEFIDNNEEIPFTPLATDPSTLLYGKYDKTSDNEEYLLFISQHNSDPENLIFIAAQYSEDKHQLHLFSQSIADGERGVIAGFSCLLKEATPAPRSVNEIKTIVETVDACKALGESKELSESHLKNFKITSAFSTVVKRVKAKLPQPSLQTRKRQSTTGTDRRLEEAQQELRDSGQLR